MIIPVSDGNIEEREMESKIESLSVKYKERDSGRVKEIWKIEV